MKKRLSVIILSSVLILSAVLTGCGNKKEFGTIKDMKDGKSGEKQKVELISKAKENGTGHDMVAFNDYYGRMMIPAPKDFTMTKESANHIELKDEKTDTTIFIEHIPMLAAGTYDDGSRKEMPEVSTFKDEFAGKLKDEHFEIDTHFYDRYVEQNLQKPGLGKEKLKVGNITLIEDYPELKLTEGTSLSHIRAFERRYYIRRNEVDTLISIISPVKYSEDSKKIIDYMYDGIKDKKEKFNYGNLEIAGSTIKVPKVYLKTSINDKVLGHADCYIVPSTSSSGLAGSFIAVFDNKKDYKLDGNRILYDVYPKETAGMDNYPYTEKMKDLSTAVYGKPAVYSKLKNSLGKTGNPELTKLIIIRSNDSNSSLLRYGSTWMVEGFSVGTGFRSKYVVIGYDFTKVDDLLNAFSVNEK